MDVTSQSFYYHLPRILDSIATCCFVSLDLEFSGIATNPVGLTGARRQTLQERYAEAKEAADKYQILQIGLTIGLEDAKTGTYTLKPYNFYLSPIIEQRLEVERIWSYQSSAVEFLVGNKFRMEAPFTEGVPYLSRDEERIALSKAHERRDRPRETGAIDVKETDTESLQFLKLVRQGIEAWLALGETRAGYLNIPPPSHIGAVSGPNALPTILNRFQKRLVHRLIEAEYPELRSIGKPTFVQIIPYDEARERDVANERVRRTDERILRQTGMRWIAEALAGGDLTRLDPGYFMGIMANSASVEGKYSLKEFADRLKLRLLANRPVLVGHNLFTDVIYFCSCFFGSLPERVEEFQELVHGLFPVLIDTKYMATHECGSINPASSLSEINDSLKDVKKPSIVVDPTHNKYEGQKLHHEAGYDSLLTAQVFIKLSSQLRNGGIPMDPRAKSFVPKRDIYTEMSELSLDSSASCASSTSGNSSVEMTGKTSRKDRPAQKPVDWQQREEVTRIRSAFAHRTKYDLLTDLAEEIEDVPESEIPVSANPLAGPTEPQLLAFEDEEAIAQKVKDGELIPRFGASFWKVYGNKLRVFGTEERVCVLGKVKSQR
ncbi:hypothetical protein DTO166G4_9170 [Paecilomyces variotii]|nr:hypothetical protein DTO166G4_9170 [Paecilomyces variotii]KAJ9227784.1 hypothetical protein DTO166G5_9163 [Paecilomyces variotii]KAJ9244834.1 hypothetical protein DTO169E5_1215 [Paecilomyces variotii]KAJ9247914.1 hypothetical protein DTO195F2_8992 [Paecilomyces variotii]KAJ9295651.1 hypothetical protein DTO217A2_8974 [Paecilomyces variotii]